MKCAPTGVTGPGVAKITLIALKIALIALITLIALKIALKITRIARKIALVALISATFASQQLLSQQVAPRMRHSYGARPAVTGTALTKLSAKLR